MSKKQKMPPPLVVAGFGATEISEPATPEAPMKNPQTVAAVRGSEQTNQTPDKCTNKSTASEVRRQRIIRAIAEATGTPIKVLTQQAALYRHGAAELVAAAVARMLPLRHAVRLARKLTKPQQARLAGALYGLGKRERLALVVATLRASRAPGGGHG